MLLTFLVHLLGSLALIPRLGAKGAALASLLGMAAAMVAGFASFRGAVRYPAGRAFLRPLGSALLAVVGAIAAWRAGTVAAMAAFVVVYAAADRLAPWPRADQEAG